MTPALCNWLPDRHKRLGSEKKALAGRAFRPDQLMVRAKNMHVVDTQPRRNALNARKSNRATTRHKNLGLTEHSLGNLGLQKHPVLWRQDQIALGASVPEGTDTDVNRARAGVLRKGVRPKPVVADPGDGLKAIVEGIDHIAWTNFSNRPLSPDGVDKGLRRKTWHEALAIACGCALGMTESRD